MPVLRHRPVAECSSSVAVEELASSSQPPPPRLPLRAVARRSAGLRMTRWGYCVFAVVAAAMMPPVRAGFEGMRASVSSRCLSGRNAAAVRSVG